MSNHPYLRAYMAGISVPTPLLLIPLTAFFIARFVYNIPVPVERVIIFPMAIIPNLFGVWNMLHTTHYGFIYFGVVEIHYTFLAVVFPAALIVYYLVWKYLIGFCNRVAGIAELART